VVTAQGTLLTSRGAALDIRGRKMSANLTLIRALGGGWHDALTTPR
jgi:outer membrane protein TolC